MTMTILEQGVDEVVATTAIVDNPCTEKDDDHFYNEVLQEMRARRLEETESRKRQSSKTIMMMENNNNSSSNLTESTASIHTFLSWANSSLGGMDDSAGSHSMMSSHAHDEYEENQYWRDLRNGKAPLPTTCTTGTYNGNGSNSSLSLNNNISNHSNSNSNSSINTVGGEGQLQASLPDLLFKLTRTAANGNGNSTYRSCDFGKFEETVRHYQYSQADLYMLAFEGRDFHRLQKSLRRQGAVTNALLKQVLPMVVMQSQKRRKARQKQALDQILELEAENTTNTQNATTQTPERPKKSKSPIPFLAQAFSFANNQQQQQQETPAKGTKQK